MIIHTVERGESLRSVAARYGVSPLKLAAINDLCTERLTEGEELLVLIPTRTATARRGERLSDIARRYGTGESSLFLMNPELCQSGGNVYDGQPITVRAEAPLFGLGIGNGYLYRTATRAQLMRALPFMSYLTVASALGRRGGIHSLFDGSWAAKLARSVGKLTLLRLYLPSGEMLSCDILRSAALMAKSEGYHGLTVAGVLPDCPALSEGRKMLSELGVKLVLELDGSRTAPDCLPCDFSVLLYDKIHLDDIPDTERGEGAVLRDFAERHPANRCFIDISPFALTEGKYITKGEMREAVLRQGGRISEVCRGVKKAVAGRRGREREWIFESLSGVRRRLELLSEHGFYGASFDVCRTPTAELMMLGTMFSESIRWHS